MNIFNFFKWRIKDKNNKNKWRMKNVNNYTECSEYIPFDSLNIKNYSYGKLNVLSLSDKSKLYIGSFCSIAPSVEFLLNAEHDESLISTYPFQTKLFSKNGEAISKGDIVVDDDVWIGYRSIILSGVHLGQGAVVAAGAVVTKEVPPYAIVGGVPAKVIKYRFSQDVIDVLMTIDYSKLDKDMISKHIDDLYRPIDEMTAEEVKQVIAWMPKK
jgi:acetyltransferase-like isoleucine patch superfamily enzyme